MIKARIHLIVAMPEAEPFSFRTDVLCLTRDPQWVHDEALGCLTRALIAIKQPAHKVRILSHSIEWVPTLRDSTEAK